MSDKVTYAFHYRSLDNNDIADEFAINDVSNRELTYDSCITWHPIVRDFLSFLSSIYGYDISKSVKFDTIEDRLNRIREENNLNGDWPWDDEEDLIDAFDRQEDIANGKGEEAPKV